MVEQVRIGVLGAGRIGRLHAENLAFRVPGAKLVAVADIDRQAAEACAERCGIGKVTDDPRRVIDDAEVDAVVICSSTDCHALQIEWAAEAGKHIFCEKPIDLELGRIDRALAAAERAKVKLQVGFNRRFDPGFRRAHDLVAEGRIGTPHVVRITSRDPEPPPTDYVKVSGGIFRDMTIHDFDMARFLIAVMDAYAGRSGSVLSPEMAREMLTPQIESTGLGPAVLDDGGDRFYFLHDGATDGYETYMVAYPKRGQGVVIMTNADSGAALWREIVNSVSVEYGLVPDYNALYVGIAAAVLITVPVFLLLRRKRANKP